MPTTSRSDPNRNVYEEAEAPNDEGSPYVVSSGSTFHGELASGDAGDRIGVQVTAGRHYELTLNGDNMPGAEFVLRDTYGNLVEAGIRTDTESGITFFAGYDGNYYVDVTPVNGRSGQYSLSVDDGSRPSESGALTEWSAPRIAAYLAEGYWSDVGHSGFAFDKQGDVSFSVNIDGMTAAGRQFSLWALEAWTYATGVSFTFDTAADADIVFGDSTPPSPDQTTWAYASSTLDESGNIAQSHIDISRTWIESDLDDSGAAILNTYSTQTFIHELGHAIGLGHAGPYNNSVGYSEMAGDGSNAYLNDSWQQTIMSYFDQHENTHVDASFAYVMTPMMSDVIAFHYLYGTQGTLRTGNDTYGPGSLGSDYGTRLMAAQSNAPLTMTIVDDGGIDHLNFETELLAASISLVGGTWSDVMGSTGNIGIAHGTLIENATTGAGNDTIVGNSADNRLMANEGNDLISGQDGNDHVFGGNGRDTLAGDRGDDYLDGGDGGDTLEGGAGGDMLLGRDGDDLIFGGAGPDTLFGQNGADFAQADADDDVLSGGPGNDTLFGGDGRDTVYGGSGNDILSGGADPDIISGGAGDDPELSGDGGDDIVFGGAGDDVMWGGPGTDLMSGGGDNDMIHGGPDGDTIYGATGHDSLHGENGADVVAGGYGNDTLLGGAGADTITGSRGNDVITGGSGADYMSGGGGADSFIFTPGFGFDTVGGFEDDIDTLLFDPSLWHGSKTTQQVLEDHGRQLSPGTVEFDFGDGDVVWISRGAGLTLANFGDDIAFFGTA